MNKTTMRILPALLLAAFSGAASAAAFQSWAQNASGLGNAYAGSAAVADNAATLFFNPAGMTLMPGLQLSAGITGIGLKYEFRDGGSVPGVGGSDGNAGGWTAVPNVYVSRQITDDLFLGMGISRPFGLNAEYDNGWLGAAQALKTEMRTLNYNPSLAYRVSEGVSLGFGVNYQTLDLELSNAGFGFKGDDSAWGWNAGALFTLSPAMRVGVSYRSALAYTLEGSAQTTGIKLPDTFILSVWQQVSDRWEAMGDLSYTRWGKVRDLGIAAPGGPVVEPFSYSNSWRFAWGAAYKSSDMTKLRFGIAYERSPLDDGERTARLPDNDRLWLSLGGQWNAGYYGKIDLGYSYLYAKDANISQNGNGINLRGRSEVGTHLLGVQYSLGF